MEEEASENSLAHSPTVFLFDLGLAFAPLYLTKQLNKTKIKHASYAGYYDYKNAEIAELYAGAKRARAESHGLVRSK